ncbi:MAG: hypothetical protein WCB95_02740, partial [Aeromicrobium sp.]
MSTPTLLDDRVDAMRAAVMGAVDTNVRARGRRVRRAGASIVAAATVIVIAGVGASLLQGSSVVTSASDGGAATTEAVDTDVRQIVRTGSATVVVNNPRREVSRVVGRIES